VPEVTTPATATNAIVNPDPVGSGTALVTVVAPVPVIYPAPPDINDIAVTVFLAPETLESITLTSPATPTYKQDSSILVAPL